MFYLFASGEIIVSAFLPTRLLIFILSPVKKPIKDPFAKREAKNYSHPIPSREFIMQQLDELAKPISFNQLTKRLQLEAEEEVEALTFRLKAMLRDGQLTSMRALSTYTAISSNSIAATVAAMIPAVFNARPAHFL